MKKQSRGRKETANIFLKRLYRDCKEFVERHVQLTDGKDIATVRKEIVKCGKENN